MQLYKSFAKEEPTNLAIILNDTIYYTITTNDYATIKYASPSQETSTEINNPIKDGNIEQMVFYNNQLYIANCNYIEKYDTSTEMWTLV